MEDYTNEAFLNDTNFMKTESGKRYIAALEEYNKQIEYLKEYEEKINSTYNENKFFLERPTTTTFLILLIPNLILTFACFDGLPIMFLILATVSLPFSTFLSEYIIETTSLKEVKRVHSNPCYFSDRIEMAENLLRMVRENTKKEYKDYLNNKKSNITNSASYHYNPTYNFDNKTKNKQLIKK